MIRRTYVPPGEFRAGEEEEDGRLHGQPLPSIDWCRCHCVCVCFFFLSVEEVVASGRWFDLMWEWLASTSRLAAPAPQYSRQSEPASPNIPHTSPHVRLEAADAAVDAEEEEEAEAVADTLLLAAARLGDDREGKWEEACEVAAVVAIASRHVHSRQTAAHSLTL